MATILAVGDIAVVHYNSNTDAFTFVLLRDVEAGTIVNFTDNGWLAAGGFRPGEDTVTYTAPSAIAAGTIVTLSGLDLDAAGDQIIAYQGNPATPTILHLVDFADGNNTVAGDATDGNTTALPPGFALGVNAVAVAFDNSLYAGPTSGSPAGLFAALNNSANWLDDDALPVPFIFNAKPTIDLDSNNSTHTGQDYEASVISGGPGVPVADTDVAISDDDGDDIFAAEFRIVGVDVRDLLTINGTLPDGIVAAAYRAPDGILRLEGQASHAAYAAAIRQVEFSTTDAPGDQKRIHVSVFDGESWSQNSTAFIEVTNNLTATPPVLDLDADNSSAGGVDATATYTAGGPARSVTDSDVLITDDGTIIESATVTILGWARNPGDLLSVAGALPGGITASTYSEITGVLTLSGPASLADYQTALHQVVYSNALPTPSIADRGIQVTVNDGGLTSNITTMYMHVVVPPPNIAPALDLDANNSTTPGANYLTGFTEGGPPVAIADTDVSIIDSDNPNLASATITLTNPQTDDVLTFDGAPPAGIVVSGSGTAVITLTGPASGASYQTALQQIKFSNGNVDPSNVTRVIEVVVSDGVSNSNTALAVVQVEAVNNSAPVIDLDPDDSGGSVRTTFRTTFTENGTPIAIADADTAITDLDSMILVSATITLANQHPGDLLTTLPLPGGIVASSYDPGTGVLTLTGMATPDEYEAALQLVLYSNTSDNPVAEDRLIEVVVNDGANTSNVAATLIGVVAVNDAPALHVDTAAVYVENAAAIALSPLATLTDVDDTELNDLVVRITGGAIPGNGDTLTVDGSTSGTINGITFLWDPADHAMVLTGASSVANYQQLLRTIAFHSTSDNPTDFNASPGRTLTWSVSGGTAVTTATTTLNIVAVNDAPQATVVATASYTENGAPVVISPASTVTDVDDINLVAGEVRVVSGAVGGDLLTVNGLESGTFSGIDFSYDASQHSLTFTHPTTVADYEAFLEAVAFSSTSDNPTDSGLSPTRTLSWFLFDGDAISDVQTTVLSISATNDAPVNTVPGAQSVNEDTALPIAGVSVTDVDRATLTTTLTVGSGKINVTPSPGVTGNGTATVIVTGAQAEINAALAGLSYTGNLNFNGLDTLTVTTGDGTTQDIDTVAITVNPVNDLPVNGVPAAQSVNEDTLLPIAGVSVADIDGGPLTTTLTVTSGTLNVTAGAGVTGNGTGAVTIAGTAAQINAALAGLSYRGNLNFNGPETLAVTTGDGIGQDIDTVAITVNPVNDPPALPPPKILSVNEDTTLLIPGVSVSDVDSLSLTTFMEVTDGIINVTAGTGATVGGNGTATITITGTVSQTNAALAGLSYRGNLNFNGEDILFLVTRDEAFERGIPILIIVNPVNDRPVLDLDANNSSGAAGADYTTSFTEGGTAVAVADLDDLVADVDNSNLAFATVTLANHQPADLLSITGTLPVGITASAYDPSTGVLTLSGPATLAAYQTALRQVAFSNSSPIPSATDRILNIVVNDGAANSAAAHAFVHLVPVDTAPALDLDADDSSGAGGADYTAVFTGGGAAVPIADADTRVADADSPRLVSATIRLTNGEATDLLSVNGTLPTGITGAFDPLTGILTLTGPASRADYQTALRQIEYDSSVPNPLTATRVIEVVVNDGTTDSNAAFSLIQIALAAPPTLDLDADDSTSGGSDYATAFTEGGAAVPIADTDIAISTPTPVSATITLTNLLPGDVLSVSGTLPDGVTDAYDPGTGVLTLTGEASAAAYRAASDQIVYSNSSDNPSTDDRIITVVVNDGINDSNTATAIVKITAVNDPPSLSVSAAASYTENDPAVLVSPAVTVSDPDSPTLTIGIAAITAGLSPGDVLTVGGLRSGTLGPVTFNWAPTLNELIVTGAGSPADYEALFQSVRFFSESDDPTNGGAGTTRTISWAVFDGTNTAVSTTTLTVSALNDAAVAQSGGASGNEDRPIAGALVATDTDSITLTYSLATPATHGSVVISPDGTYVYTPDADFNGFDSFAFVANDGVTDSNVATVTLTVHPVGDRPPGQGPGGVPVLDPNGFDAGFYLAVNPDVAAAGVDPLDHFNTFGWREGRNPSSSFDTAYYLAQNPDVAAAGVNPLEHFNIFGWHEGRDPSAYFDTSGYLEHYADVAAAGVNPLQHYREFGWYEGRDPSLGFDTTQYLAVYEDVAAAHVDPLGHFLHFGIREGRSPVGDGFWE